MTSHVANESSAALAALLDRSVLRARLIVVMKLAGALLITLAAAVVAMAVLDHWLKPEHFWFGGSVVWLLVLVNGWTRGNWLGLPRAWPTRLSVAHQWEQRWPHLGSQVSSAVGFVEPGEDVSQVSPDRVLQVSSAGLRALAIEHARLAVRDLPVASQPAGGRAVFELICGGACLLLVVGIGQSTSPHWQHALARQVPPAVGGWPSQSAEAGRPGRQIALLSSAELSQATRRLVGQFTELDSLLQQRVITLRQGEGQARLRSYAEDVRLLTGRLPPATPAWLIRQYDQILRRVLLTDDTLPAITRMVTLGQAAVSLADAAAIEGSLARQVTRLFRLYPGVPRTDLPAVVAAQLDRLAESQRVVRVVVQGARDSLTEAGAAADILTVENQEWPGQFIAANQLALAAAAAGKSADQLAAAATEFGLLVPATPSWQAGNEATSLAGVFAAVAGVEAELDAATLTKAAAGGGKRPPAAATGGRNLPDEESGLVAAADTAGKPGSGRSSGPVAPASQQSQEGRLGAVIAGPGWRLQSPITEAPGRMAVDETFLPETAAAFGDYLQQVAPGRSSHAGARSSFRETRP